MSHSEAVLRSSLLFSLAVPLSWRARAAYSFSVMSSQGKA